MKTLLSVWLTYCCNKLPHRFRVQKQWSYFTDILPRLERACKLGDLSLICGMSAGRMEGPGGSSSEIVVFFVHGPGLSRPLDPSPPPHEGWISESFLVA